MPPKKSLSPPRWAERLLEWLAADHLLEEVQGDLQELFEKRLQTHGLRKARLYYILDLLKLIHPRLWRNKPNTYSSPNLFTMLENYFKIAWRNVITHKIYSSIKIGGFALAIAACLLITLFIRDELSYDQQYANADCIYRVVVDYKQDNIKGIHFPAPFAKVLKEEFPEVEQVARFTGSGLYGEGSNQLRRADQRENTFEDGFIYVDQEIVDILGLKLIYGTREEALNKPNTLLLSKRKADKYFPNENPLGKLLILNNDEKNAYTIGGVIEDFPATSHLQYDFLLTMTGRELWEGEQSSWRFNNYTTYVSLRKGANAAALEKKLASVTEKYLIPTLKEAGHVDVDKLAITMEYILQPITDIHLKSYEIQDGLPHGDTRFIWLFGAIAVFILIIASINFINLSTAKSANRAKEVGIRKVVGSVRSNLINQFLTESILFSSLSFLAGLLLAWLLLPYFNILSAKSLLFPWTDWQLMLTLTGAALVVGTLAGIYPSLYLSAFKPIDVLKGKLSTGSKNNYTRSTLVVFQFTTSIVLLIATFIIYRQMEFILHKKVGFDKEQVLLIRGAHTLEDKVQSLKNELLRLPEVKQVSISDYLPIKGTNRNQNPFWKEGKSKEDIRVNGQLWQVDHDYIKTLGIKIIEGRDFSRQMASDSQAIIINKAMVRQLGLKSPTEERIMNWKTWNVIGVVDDFHYESLRDSIQPMALILGNSPSVLSVKFNTGETSALLQSINNVWREFAPNQPIQYSFLDENFAQMYEDVRRTGRIFTSFAVLAIIVACLGLYGLSAFMVEQRSKEIGVRIVLGASFRSIFGLLTFNFVKLVLLSFIIATPIAWYLMQRWLENFVYRTQISPGVFLLAGSTALLIALITISYQTIRAALVNPMKNLRSE